MPANNVKQIKIWISAHAWLIQLSLMYAARGINKSMTSLASEAILNIPEPLPNGNGNGHTPDQIQSNHEED
jgi:hypothetical protein